MSKLSSLLFIDNDEITNFLTREILRQKGFIGDAAFLGSAVDALTYLKENEGRHQPDVIFLDIKMPEVSGFGFLDIFLAEGLEKIIKSRIYMLSSSVSNSDLEKSHAYPIVHGFLQKPFTYEKLQKL